jgi:hypothetical protein
MIIMLHKLRITLVAIVVALTTVSTIESASALFGYIPIGGYERGGYEYSGP